MSKSEITVLSTVLFLVRVIGCPAMLQLTACLVGHIWLNISVWYICLVYKYIYKYMLYMCCDHTVLCLFGHFLEKSNCG